MDEDTLTSEHIVLELIPDGVQVLMDESISDEEIVDLSFMWLERASGRPWYVALRMVGVLRNNWNVLGAEILKRAVDPVQLSLSGLLDITLLQALQAMEESQVTMFLTELEMPPPGVDVSEEDMEMSREQFLSLAD